MPENIEVNVNIGEAIRRGLQAKGWTQRKLAEIMGVSSALVSGWIRNSKTPTGGDIIKIALLLEIVPLLFPTEHRPGAKQLHAPPDIPEDIRYEFEKVWREINSLKRVVQQ